MTTVISGIEINAIEPPSPDLATPYNMIAGIVQAKNKKSNSIVVNFF
jgi:hypothetical protein